MFHQPCVPALAKGLATLVTAKCTRAQLLTRVLVPPEVWTQHGTDVPPECKVTEEIVASVNTWFTNHCIDVEDTQWFSLCCVFLWERFKTPISPNPG